MVAVETGVIGISINDRLIHNSIIGPAAVRGLSFERAFIDHVLLGYWRAYSGIMNVPVEKNSRGCCKLLRARITSIVLGTNQPSRCFLALHLLLVLI